MLVSTKGRIEFVLIILVAQIFLLLAGAVNAQQGTGFSAIRATGMA